MPFRSVLRVLLILCAISDHVCPGRTRLQFCRYLYQSVLTANSSHIETSYINSSIAYERTIVSLKAERYEHILPVNVSAFQEVAEADFAAVAAFV